VRNLAKDIGAGSWHLPMVIWPKDQVPGRKPVGLSTHKNEDGNREKHHRAGKKPPEHGAGSAGHPLGCADAFEVVGACMTPENKKANSEKLAFVLD
jgi:hypothetical protein